MRASTRQILELQLASDSTIAPERARRALSLLAEEPPAGLPPNAPILVGVGIAAKILGISRSTFWRMVHRQQHTVPELRPTVLPGTVLQKWRVQELTALANRRIDPSSRRKCRVR